MLNVFDTFDFKGFDKRDFKSEENTLNLGLQWIVLAL